jgi:hypothetical protein
MGSQTTGPKGSDHNRETRSGTSEANKGGSEVVTRRSDKDAQHLDRLEGPWHD